MTTRRALVCLPAAPCDDIAEQPWVHEFFEFAKFDVDSEYRAYGDAQGLWEAAEAGSIPVVVRNGTGHPCHGALDPYRDAPFLWVDDLAHAFDRMVALAADPHALEAAARSVRDWYAALSRRTIRRVEALTLGATSVAACRRGVDCPRGKHLVPLVTGAPGSTFEIPTKNQEWFQGL